MKILLVLFQDGKKNNQTESERNKPESIETNKKKNVFHFCKLVRVRCHVIFDVSSDHNNDIYEKMLPEHFGGSRFVFCLFNLLLFEQKRKKNRNFTWALLWCALLCSSSLSVSLCFSIIERALNMKYACARVSILKKKSNG